MTRIMLALGAASTPRARTDSGYARSLSKAFLATPDDMKQLLSSAGFKIMKVRDSTEESQRWFEELSSRTSQSGPAVTFQTFLGNDFPAMARNQVANLRDRRIRTVSYICEASRN